MNLEFLLALIYPRAIAPHPNFRSVARPSVAASIAATLLQEPPVELARRPTEAEAELIELAKSVSESEYNGFTLPALKSGRGDLPPCAYAARAVLVTVNSIQLGLPDSAFAEEALAQLRDETPETRLARAWLMLGIAAIRNWEGARAKKDLAAVRHELRDIAQLRFDDFETTQGLDLEQSAVARRVVDLLDHAAISLTSTIDPWKDDGWQDRVRRPVPYLLSSLDRLQAGGFEQWIGRQFEAVFQPGVRHLGGSLVPGDDDLLTALIIAECSFHPSARHFRAGLGRSRLLRSNTGDPDVDRQLLASGLRLMRLSSANDSVPSIVEHILSRGPVGVVRSEAQQLWSGVRRKGFASLADLNSLRVAAYVIDPQMASEIHEFLVAERSAEGGLWQREAEMSLMASLVGPGEDATAVTRSLIQVVGNSDDELLDRALARALMVVVSAGGDDAYQVLGSFLESRPGLQVSRDAFDSWIINRQGENVFFVREMDVSLAGASRAIDKVLANPEKSDTGSLRQWHDVVQTSLQELTDSAANGVHSVGGLSSLNVAVAFAIAESDGTMWEHAMAALLDQRVDREAKAQALLRIARNPNDVPVWVSQLMSDRFQALLHSWASGFDGRIDPFPEAVRAACALELLTRTRLSLMVGRLLSSPSVNARVEGVRCLQEVSGKDGYGWAMHSALLLSHDPHPWVRAEVVRALCLLGTGRGANQWRLMRQRINELLDLDGSRAALQFLGAMGDPRVQRGLRMSEFITRITSLTENPDWRVRRKAEALLRSISPGQ